MANDITKNHAKRLASHGRNGDTALVHMHPDEVRALSGIASLAGRKLTRNPKTGLMEAFNLFDILPMVLNFIPGIGTAASIALSAASGAASAAVEGNDPLQGGLMGGLTGGLGAAIGGPASAALPQAAGGATAQAVQAAGQQAASLGGAFGGQAGADAIMQQAAQAANPALSGAALSEAANAMANSYGASMQPGMMQDIFGAGTDAKTDGFLGSLTKKENLPWVVGGLGALAGSGLFDQATGTEDNPNAKAHLRKPGPPRTYTPIQNQPGLSLQDYGTYGQMGGSMPYEANFFSNNPGPYTGDPYTDDPNNFPFSHGGMVRRYAFGGSVAPPAGSGPQAQTQSTAKSGMPWQPQAATGGQGSNTQQSPLVSSGLANSFSGALGYTGDVMQQPQPTMPASQYKRGGTVKEPGSQGLGAWWAGQGTPPNNPSKPGGKTSDGKPVSVPASLVQWGPPPSQPTMEQILAAQAQYRTAQGPPPPVKLFEPVRGYALGGKIDKAVQSLPPDWWRGGLPPPPPTIPGSAPPPTTGAPTGVPGTKGSNPVFQKFKGILPGFMGDKLNAKHGGPMQGDGHGGLGYNPHLYDPNFKDEVGWIGGTPPSPPQQPTKAGSPMQPRTPGAQSPKSMMHDMNKLGRNNMVTAPGFQSPTTSLMSPQTPVNPVAPTAGAPVQTPAPFQPVSGFAGGGLASMPHMGHGSHLTQMHLQHLMQKQKRNHRMVGGSGGGMDDTVPAMVDGRQPAALSSGEYVVPADAVGHLGDGNSAAGAKHLDAMIHRIRVAKSGRSHQPGKLNHRKVMPA